MLLILNMKFLTVKIVNSIYIRYVYSVYLEHKNIYKQKITKHAKFHQGFCFLKMHKKVLVEHNTTILNRGVKCSYLCKTTAK